jgi:hypothetical protein
MVVYITAYTMNRTSKVYDETNLYLMCMGYIYCWPILQSISIYFSCKLSIGLSYFSHIYI